MTDEEMAEEYTRNLLKGMNCNIGNPRARKINSIDVEEAFLAGLAEGRLKWNKVADGVLPDNYHSVWTNVGAGYHDNYGWWDIYGILQGVVAWCEPTFLEEPSE